MNPASELNGLLAEAHYKSAFRNNISSTAVAICAESKTDFLNAVVAAISTLGGIHAPIAKAFRLINHSSPTTEIQAILDSGERVPGWGNSFHKTGIDPIWAPVDECLKMNYHSKWVTLTEMTAYLHSCGRKIFPNPACYTATVAAINGLTEDSAGYLFLSSRLSAWLKIYSESRS
jgi:citrate synthase